MCFAPLGLTGQVKLDKGGYAFYAQTFDRCLAAAKVHLRQLQEQEWPALAVVREALLLIDGKAEGLRGRVCDIAIRMATQRLPRAKSGG